MTSDLIPVQYHSLTAGHDDGHYVRDAENAGLDDVAAGLLQGVPEPARGPRRWSSHC